MLGKTTRSARVEDSDLTFFVPKLSLVTENDLLVSKAAMNLCILQFLPHRLLFRDQVLYRGAAPVFVTPSVSRVPEISDSRNFSGSSSR